MYLQRSQRVAIFRWKCVTLNARSKRQRSALRKKMRQVDLKRVGVSGGLVFVVGVLWKRKYESQPYATRTRYERKSTRPPYN